jgi:uncharacterized protein (TIGR02099 family)
VNGRRARRLATGLAVWGLVVLGVVLVALRIAVARVPAYSAEIRRWVEDQTQLQFEFERLDARLRWYGPEVVLVNARLLEPAGDQALIATREVRIALDVWSLFHAGELVAGRLELIGAEAAVVRLPDGRIRLLGQAERPADRPPFDLDRLPAGRVAIVDATVRYRDMATGRGPWQLDRVELQLERGHGAVHATGHARLPAEMGSKIEFAGHISGTLMKPETLAGRLEAEVDRARLAGWTELLPSHLARIERGDAELEATVGFMAGRLDELKVDIDASDLALRLPARRLPSIQTVVLTDPQPGPAGRLPVGEKLIVARPASAPPKRFSYEHAAARLRLRRDDGAWVFRAAEIDVVPSSGRGATRGARGDISGRFSGKPGSVFALKVDARDLQLQDLWPLALAFAPAGADGWLGFGPRGEVHALSLDVARERAGAIPRFSVSADVEDLSIAPSGRRPGLRGVTATLSGTDERGRLALRLQHGALTWPAMFREPLTVDELHADLDWRRDGRTWILEGRDLRVERPDAQANGDLELRFVNAHVSPELYLDADVQVRDIAIVPDFLPVGRLQPRSLSWLDRAFAGGSARGHVSYRGPVRRFPFRNGEGEFVATAQLSEVALDYFPGYAPLTNGQGRVTFRNRGLDGALTAGRIGGLELSGASVRIADLKAPVIEVESNGSADVSAALAYLRASPLAPKLGALFAQFSGSGPASFSVALTLPTREPRDRDYRVRTTFRSATLNLAPLRAPLEEVTGTLELHNLEARADDLKGRFLDGPFEVTVTPGDGASEDAVAVNVGANGRLSGQRLPALIGLPDTIVTRGSADWTLALRAERRAPAEAWATRVAVTSNLTGLAIEAPRPFAKSASESRDTRVRIDLGADARTEVEVASGAARAQLEFVREDERWQLDRGVARFDGRPMPARLAPGLQVLGDWPEFDLGEWLALRGSPAVRGQRVAWLKRVDVQLDEAQVFGYRLQDVRARMTDDGVNWLVDLTCPMVTGRISVPLDASAARPIVLDLRQLVLESAGARRATARSDGATDPRRWPSVRATIDDMTWHGRHLGRVTAEVQREVDGLRLETLRAVTPSYTIVGSGAWRVDGLESRTALDLRFDSADLASAAQALGYRQSIEAERAHAQAALNWPGGPTGEVLRRLNGTVQIDLGRGRLKNVEPGAAGRVLGLVSVVELPRRLALDFRDVTDEGLAFDSVRGDFEVRDGTAYTQNLLLSGAAVDIGIAGRTNLGEQTYDQTVVVSGNPSGALTVAGALAAGPVVGAGVLVLSQLFKGQLQGLTRAYYRVTGPWSDPVVQRVTAAANEGLAAQAATENVR